MTRSPGFLETGMLSPVSADSSTLPLPSTTFPSTGDAAARPDDNPVAPLQVSGIDFHFGISLQNHCS